MAEIDESSYVWTTQRDDHVLVKGEYGYAIVNKSRQLVLHIEDDEARDGAEGRTWSEAREDD